jgi:hypothetical protein
MKSLSTLMILGLLMAGAEAMAEPAENVSPAAGTAAKPSVASIAPIESPTASAGGAILEARFHAALNKVVQDIRDAKTPMQKREILQRFVTRMNGGLEKAKTFESLKDRDRKTLEDLQKRFYAYDAELNGRNGYAKVEDGSLNDFAGYIQQDMEQAPMGGGIYISGGALIVILILLIILL